MSLSLGDLQDRRHSPAGFAGGGRTKPQARGHLARVTALAAAALVTALCLPAGRAYPDTVEPRQPAAKEHIVPSAARSTR